MIDFLAHLFDTSDFTPRWDCGNWSPGHGWLHIVCDLGIWSAYIAIPCVLGYFVLHRKNFAFRRVFLLFGAFILACGTTHLMEAVIFWWPAYRLSGVIKLITAIVSWSTVLALVPVTPRALAMRSPEELELEIAGRKEAETALQAANVELARQIEALRASEERFRLLVDGTEDHAIFLLDSSGRVVSWNPGAQRIKQYRAEEIIGQHFSRFYAAEDIQAGKPDRGLQVAVREGRSEDEGWRVRKDGSRFWANVVITALRDDQSKLRGFSKITRDMTARKQAEENARRLIEEEAARQAAETYAAALQASEQRWSTMAEALPNLVWTDTPDGQCDWLSSQWNQYTGIPEHELLGLGWLERVLHPDDKERTLACWQAACADQGNYDLEYRIRRHDGIYHWFKTRGVPIRDPQGRIVYWFGTCTDIEDVKQLEAALRETDRRKNEFLATLAHELRNPLAPLRTGVQLLRLTDQPDAQERTLQMMERQLAQMVRLIDDLMDVSRISRNKMELRRAPITLASAVENAVETARPQIDARGHKLSVKLPAEPVMLDADLTRLSQVFWNLLINSAKYTDPGGQIELSAERNGTQVVVSVKDNGIGIPPRSLPGLFTLFSQVEGTLDRSEGGLGIGLALVKGLVEMHGGKIEGHSGGLGQGSEFVVRLPLGEARGVVENGVPIEPAGELGKRRVMIVDDNRDATASMGMMLSLLGLEVRAAHDGLEALELAEAFRPEVILLDIGLPRMNGYDTCHRIRERPWARNVFIIAVTGWGQQDDRRRAQEAGFDHHMLKPVDFETLERLLAELPTPTS